MINNQSPVGKFTQMVIKASENNFIYLVVGNEGGKRAWYYIKVAKNQLPLFQKTMQEKADYDLSKYGAILYSGWGEKPPAEIAAKIKQQYGG